jgi:hypothetical protein
MPAQPRSFIDAFSGTAEIKQAYLLIGWIAVNHARIEQRLSYLAWQLEVFDLAGRKKYRNKTDAEIRTLAKERRIDPKRPVGRIEDFVNMVEEHLAKQRVARRLQEAVRTARERHADDPVPS